MEKRIHLSRLLCRPLEDSFRFECDFESLSDLERLLSERLEAEAEFFGWSWRRTWWSSCRRLSRLLSLSWLRCCSRPSSPRCRSSRSLSWRRESLSRLRSLSRWCSRSRSDLRLSEELVLRLLWSSSRLDSRSSFFLSADRLSRCCDSSFFSTSLLTGWEDVLLTLVASGLQSPEPSAVTSAGFSASFPSFSFLFSIYKQ